MEWGVAQTALVVAGVLFLLCVVASLHPRVSLSLTSRIVLSAGAGAYVAAAIGFRRADSVSRVPVAWLVPIVLVAVLAVVARDVMTPVVARAHGRDRLGTFIPAPARSMGAVASPVDAAASPTATETVLAQASDPTTSPSDLADLAYTAPEARSAVAANPGTPASVLTWLAANGDTAVVAAIAERQETFNAAEAGR